MAAVPLLDLASCAPVAAQLCDGKGFLLKTPRANRSLSAHFELVDHDSVPAAAFPASGVKSAVILKPVLADIACFQRTVRYDQQHNQLLLTKPADNCSGTTKETAFNSSYFDAVYDGADARQQLYSEALPLVDALMQGRNAAVLAYGQTGSGKTYQMEGSIDRRCDWGLIPFVVEEILHRVEESRDGNFLVSLSYVEFYKEQLHDLLVDCGKGPGAQLASLGLRQNGEGNYDIAGVQEVVVADLNQVVGLMRAGSRRRHTAAHDLNERSSRSFADVIIKVESMHTVGGKQVTCCSRLHLCDLAGSERQTRTSAAGDRLKEASAINTTLHVLRRVVQARVQQAERRANERPAGAIQPPESLVPYNESKLTKVLKETLSGNAMLLVICCLSQSPSDYADSLATLQFAQACKSLTATPKVRYISGGQIAGVTDDLRSLANADVAAELAAQRDKLMLLQTDVMSQEQELERQRKKVNYLETELVCERAQAQGQRAKQANLALELRLSVEHIIDSTCDLMGAYVAGGGADILGRVLASQLPHLQRALDSPAMLSQLGSQHLLRLVKAFLQVNYSMADGLTRTLEGLFGLLRSPRTSACWGDAVAFCLSEMAAHVTRARQLPAYVLHNFLNMLSGIAKHLGAETAAQLDAAHALAAMAGFLSAAKTAAEANPATDRAHITQRTVTVINVLGDRLFSANRSVTSLPSFQEVAQGVQHFKALLVTAEAQAPAASTNHQAAATSDPARRGTAPAAADNQPGTAALRRKSYALRSRGPVPDSAGQAGPATDARVHQAMRRARIIGHLGPPRSAAARAAAADTLVSHRVAVLEDLDSAESDAEPASAAISAPTAVSAPAEAAAAAVGSWPAGGKQHAVEHDACDSPAGPIGTCTASRTQAAEPITRTAAVDLGHTLPAHCATATVETSGSLSEPWMLIGSHMGEEVARVSGSPPLPCTPTDPAATLATGLGQGLDTPNAEQNSATGLGRGPALADAEQDAAATPAAAPCQDAMSTAGATPAATAARGSCAAHLEPAAIDSPTLLLNFDTLDARDTWLTPFGAGTPDAKWLDERAYEREQLSSTVKPLNFESAAPAAPSSLARFNQRTILSPIQQQAGRPVPSAHRPGLGAKTPSRFYAATEQDKENALVTARLQEALANATPLPNTAVGTQTHMSSTPATSLLELRQRFQLSSLAAGSCLSAIKPSKYSGLGSFLTPAPASKSAAGAAPALGLTPKTAMRNVKDKLALLQ